MIPRQGQPHSKSQNGDEDEEALIKNSLKPSVISTANASICCNAALQAFNLSTGFGFAESNLDEYVPTITYDHLKQHPDIRYVPSLISPPISTWKLLMKDWNQIIFLLILYIVQGIPMGLSASIPFLLQGNVSYKELGLFSLVSLPFSLKVFWAPIVDSVYLQSVGRRKTWLVPVQLICSLLMWWGSFPHTVDRWMGQNRSGTFLWHPNVPKLLFYFGTLYFLMATQDIAVDGWSLTILSSENRSFSSACNAVGQTLGISIAHVGFLTLHDPRICNRWFRSVPSDVGLVTLGSFLRFWSFVILISTMCAFFFSEKEDNGSDDRNKFNDEYIEEPPLTVYHTYYLLVKMISIPSVLQLILLMVSCRFAFAPIDAATHLKLVEAGMTKEDLAFFGPFLLPLEIICPMLIGKLTRGPRPLRWFLRGWRVRWFISFIWMGLIPLTRYIHSMIRVDGLSSVSSTPFWLYASIFSISAIHSISMLLMFSSQMAFFARVADPSIGGTYMTFLNTITNIGNKWPTTLSLLTLDVTSSMCPFLDGFTLQIIIFSMIGILWLKLFTPMIHRLENLDSTKWLVKKSKNNLEIQKFE